MYSPSNEFMNGFADVNTKLGRCFKEWPANLVSIGNSLLCSYHSLRLQVTFVTTYHLDSIYTQCIVRKREKQDCE